MKMSKDRSAFLNFRIVAGLLDAVLGEHRNLVAQNGRTVGGVDAEDAFCADECPEASVVHCGELGVGGGAVKQIGVAELGGTDA